jgi:hypothetical protein
LCCKKTDRNVPAEHIRERNTFTAIQGVSVAWKFIMPVVIQTCFVKCGLRTASSINANNDEENSEWVEVQGHTDCQSIFDEFLNVDKSVPTTSNQPTSLEGKDPPVCT